VAEWALSYRETGFDPINTLYILLGTFDMDVGQGEVPIIPLIGVHHCLLLSQETLSPPRASIDQVPYMSCTSWLIQFANKMKVSLLCLFWVFEFEGSGQVFRGECHNRIV